MQFPLCIRYLWHGMHHTSHSGLHKLNRSTHTCIAAYTPINMHWLKPVNILNSSVNPHRMLPNLHTQAFEWAVDQQSFLDQIQVPSRPFLSVDVGCPLSPARQQACSADLRYPSWTPNPKHPFQNRKRLCVNLN